jgi:hypothetical protein
MLGVKEIFFEVLEAKGRKVLALEYIVQTNIHERCQPT